MTLHFTTAPAPPKTVDDAMPMVLSIANQIDAEGLSASERANVAVTYLIETSDVAWPMALQREILAAATAALQATTPAAKPAPQPPSQPQAPPPSCRGPAPRIRR